MEEISYSTLSELPTPTLFKDILNSQSERGFLNPHLLKHTYVKDGLMVRGIDLTDQTIFKLFSTLLNESLATINQVEDEHLKSLGMVAAGFLRFIEIDLKNISPSNAPWDFLNLRLFFRFTTDLCPAGLRMLRKTRTLLEDLYIRKANLGIKRFVLECYHAGTPWNISDVNDESQRKLLAEMLSVVMQEEIALIPINFT